MMEPYRGGGSHKNSNNNARRGQRGNTQVANYRGGGGRQGGQQLQHYGSDPMWPSVSGGRDIDHIHEDFKHHRGQMIERMDKMHENMFKGFGKYSHKSLF